MLSCVKKQNNLNLCLFKSKSLLFFTFLVLLLNYNVTIARASYESNFKEKNFSMRYKRKIKLAMFHKKCKKKWAGLFKDNSIFFYKKDLQFIFPIKYKNFSKKDIIFAKKKLDLLYLGEMLEKIAENDKWNLSYGKIHLKDILTYQFDLLSNENLKFFCKCNLKLKKKPLLYELFQPKIKHTSERKDFFKLLAIYIKKKGKYSKEVFLSDSVKNFLHVTMFNNSHANILDQLITIQSTSYFYECFLKFSSNAIRGLIKENWNKKKTNKSFVSGQFELVFNFSLASNQIKKQKLGKNCHKKYFKKNKNLHIFKNIFLEKSSNVKLNDKNKKKIAVVAKENKNSFYLNESFGLLKKKFKKKNLKKRCRLEEINISDFYFIQILKLRKKKYKPSFSCVEFFINFYPNSIYKKNFLPDFKKNYNALKTAFLSYKHISNTNVFLANKKKEDILYLFTKNTTFPNNAESINFVARLNYTGINFPKNSRESFKLYKKSALLGNLYAEFSLSQMNFYGSGKKRKKDDFFFLVKTSSNKKFTPSRYNHIVVSASQCVNKISLFNCIKKLFENYNEKRSFKKIKQTYMESNSSVFFSKNRILNEIEMVEFSEKLFYLTFNILFGLMENKLASISLSLAHLNKDSGWYKILSIAKIKNILTENKQFFLSTELQRRHEDFGFIKKVLSFSSQLLKKLF